MSLGTTSRTRCAVVWAGVTVLAAALMTALVPTLLEAVIAVRRSGSAHAVGLAGVDFETLLVWCCAAAAAAVTCWLWMVATLVTLDTARGQLTARRGVPEAMRRALLALCGLALASGLAGGLAAPASAANGTSPGDTDEPPNQLSGLRLPERAAVAQRPQGGGDPRSGASAGGPAGSTAPMAAPQAGPTAMVLVTAGDTLWDLAAEQLGRGASPAETAAAWPALYAHNREVIGPDPGLIEPGQRLQLPPAGTDGGAR